MLHQASIHNRDRRKSFDNRRRDDSTMGPLLSPTALGELLFIGTGCKPHPGHSKIRLLIGESFSNRRRDDGTMKPSPLRQYLANRFSSERDARFILSQLKIQAFDRESLDRFGRTRDVAETPDGQRAPGLLGQPRCPQVSQR
jgi:hypothetical protein